MTDPITRTVRAACVLLILYYGLCTSHAHADTKWHVKEAPIRFRVSLSQGPTQTSAGYFLQLPDGGILPGPSPSTRVVDASGNLVSSYLLWQNPSTGLAIVFAAPAASGDVFVYVMAGRQLRLWSPATGLTPSAILCADSGRGAIASARQLAQMGRVGARTRYQMNEAHPRAPLCIKGDLNGHPRPGSFYLLSYVRTTDPGKTWIASFKGQDSVEVRIDGKAMTSHKRIDKWGGTGAWVNLAEGLHRVEMFAGCGGSGAYGGNGVVWLAWATPNATAAELGGVRSASAPFPGTPKWASRPVSSSEIVSSGKCTIRDVRARDGGPAALIKHWAIENYWAGNHAPVFTYGFRAITTGNPEGTRYSWQFSGDAQIEGKQARWLLTGQKEHTIRLTAILGNRKSVATIPVYAFSTVRTSLNSQHSRKNMREAFLSMIGAYSENADVAASWTPGMWQCFFDIQELGKGQALLHEVLVKRKSTFRKRIPANQLLSLQDIFFHWISHKDPDKAIKWLKQASQESRIPGRKHTLSIRIAEVHMYHKKNYSEARRILKGMSIGTKPHTILATIRLGDVAFLEGNLNEANRYWGKVENKTDIEEMIQGDGAGVRWAGEAARSGEISSRRSRILSTIRRAGGSKSQDWRKAAVLDSNISTSINSLLIQGFYPEALRELSLWERYFPLSKLSEDYILLEARCFLTLDNIPRARALLEAYCENVDASSYLPDAVSLLERCLINQRTPKSELKAFYEKMSKRLEYHPAGQRMKDKLKYL